MQATEQVAAAFHEAYERLAPLHGYETRPESAVPWQQVPEANRDLMTAVVADLEANGIITLEVNPPQADTEAPEPSYADGTMQPAIDNATQQMAQQEAARTGTTPSSTEEN